MSFYGYDPNSYKKDYSGVAKIGAIAGDTIRKAPGAIRQAKEYKELKAAYEEGKVNNDDIYQTVSSEIKAMDDVDANAFFGMNKASVLKMLKPGRREGSEYMQRVSKIAGEGLKSHHAKQNLMKAKGKIRAIGKGQDVADEVGQTRLDQTFKGGGMDVQGDLKGLEAGSVGPSSEFKPVPNYATPEQIQDVGQRFNVPENKLGTEMTQAKNIRDAKQLRGLDVSGTQANQMQSIGGKGEGIGETTMQAIKTLPNESQEAASIFKQSAAQTANKNADTNRIKAETDKNREKRLMAGAKTSNLKELKNVRNSYVTETKNYQNALDDITYRLNSAKPHDIDDQEWEKTRKDLLRRQKQVTRDLMNARKEIKEYNKLIAEETGADVGDDYIDDDVLDMSEVLESGRTAENEPGEVLALRMGKLFQDTWGINVPSKTIEDYLKKGYKPVQIMQVISEMRQ